MYFKFIDGELVICKPNVMGGNYSFVRYCSCENKISIKNKLLDFGFTLRGSDIIGGIKDKFGDECIYNSDECIKLQGKSFSRFRNILKRYKIFEDTVFYSGYNIDIDVVAQNWATENNSKHQLKLLKVIKNNLDLVNITRIYYKTKIIGFSVIEILNNHHGIIIQRLINPDIKAIIIEPNILIHFCDCYNNPSMLLNIGASRNKNLKVAKDKLRPHSFLKIRRIISKIKPKKKHLEYFKNNLAITAF
jgi:hypothetical protein